MTAEIAILNRQGVALAADSAVTIGRERVWKNTNKLFSMSPRNDIAVMAYGAGDFVGFPWETIVKSFRVKTGDCAYLSVAECAGELMAYLSSDEFSRPTEGRVSILIGFVKQLERLKRAVGTYQSKAEFRSKLKTAIEAAKQRVESEDLNTVSIEKAAFLTSYSSAIADLVKDQFKEHITGEIRKLVEDFLFCAFCRKVVSSYETGIVVAGFGQLEMMPSLVTFIVDGRDGQHLRVWRDDEKSHDMNAEDAEPAAVIPFGQSDISTLFLEGISGQHLRWMRRTMKAILDDKSDALINAYVQQDDQKVVERTLQRRENTKVIREMGQEFRRYRDRSLVQPVMQVITTLPKEEMADMAEALVEITSLRRRVDSRLETVGGPTDVAVISKGDGLIWIKRKHYFDPNINGDFARRKELQNRRSQDHDGAQ